MIWFLISVISLLISWWALAASNSKLRSIFSLGALIGLLLWLDSLVELTKLGQDEEALLLWFAIGLIILIVNAVAHFFDIPSSWDYILKSASAFSYALGLDVFRPDSYALIPAAIIALMVILVGTRAVMRLLRSNKIPSWINQVAILSSTTIFSLMLYASFYKLLDRGWLLPWSYLAALGALLFVLSQLWKAWQDLGLSENKWRARIFISYDLAQYFLIVSAYYHYSQYI